MQRIDWSDPGQGYREAAAVLAQFRPEALQPMGGAVPLEDALPYLLAETTATRDEQEGPQWMLQHDVRRATLERLGTRTNLEAALAANPDRPDSPLQKILEAYIAGTARPIARQSLEELMGTLQVVEWLDGILDDVPDRSEVTRRIALEQLLAPLRHLAGEHFRGRERELTQLHDYVRVQAPADANADLPRFWLIYGPGGLGKSTLIAKFILQIMDETPEAERFPFVYVDFDRPGMLAEQPVTLLIEAARQLAAQYPEVADECAQLRAQWTEAIDQTEQFTASQSFLHKSVRVKGLRGDIIDANYAIQDDFAGLARRLTDDGRKPLLFVLDTFEEVQFRSRDSVAELGDFMRRLQRGTPSLRVVLAGRSPIDEFPTQPGEPLGDLDDEAALGYLELQGLHNDALARIVVREVKGNPLSLRLAARVIDDLQEEKHGQLSLSDVQVLLRSVEASQIQGFLYRRILKYLHDKRVQPIAHPGLVLRRITPEIILEVLAEPCGLSIKTLDEARELFYALQREASLVKLEYQDGQPVLVHRSDVRRAILDALKPDEPTKVPWIHRNAVGYYGRFEDPRSRAEEIYHRLFREADFQNVDARWLPGVEPYLGTALSEVPLWAQAELASRLRVEGFEVNWNQASAEAWERRAEKRVLDLVERGRFERALETLSERGKVTYTVGSPLYLLEARALAGLRRWEAARIAANNGIASISVTDHREQLLDLYLLSAQANEMIDNYGQALEVLAEAKTLAATMEDDLPILEVTVRQARVHRLAGDISVEELGLLRRRVVERYTAATDHALRSYPRLVRDVVQEIALDHPEVLPRALGLLEMQFPDARQQAQLLDAMVEWELALRAANPPKSLFLGESLPGFEPIPDAPVQVQVMQFVQYAMKVKDRGAVLLALLLKRHPAPRPVIEVLVDILQGTQAEQEMRDKLL